MCAMNIPQARARTSQVVWECGGVSGEGVKGGEGMGVGDGVSFLRAERKD